MKKEEWKEMRQNARVELAEEGASDKQCQPVYHRFSNSQSATAEFKLPLVTVRPECAGILRDVPMDEPKLSPASHSVSPFFMENGHPDKYIKKGENNKKGIQNVEYLHLPVFKSQTMHFFVTPH